MPYILLGKILRKNNYLIVSLTGNLKKLKLIVTMFELQAMTLKILNSNFTPRTPPALHDPYIEHPPPPTFAFISFFHSMHVQ